MIMVIDVIKNKKFIFSGSHDDTIKMWHIQKCKVIRTFRGHARQIRSIAIMKDIKYIVTGSHDKTIKIWNI